MKSFAGLLSKLFKLTLLSLLAILIFPLLSLANVPAIRVKTGVSSLTLNAGQRVVNQPLNSIVTFQPSILWAIPEFSARLGVHYLQEMGSTYGLTPLQGIGASGYYYFYGISTSYNESPDGVLIEKSRQGPYIMGSLTPANFNLNKTDSAVSSGNFYFSALIYDLSLAWGYDYPINQNMVISAEFAVRNGSGADTKSEPVRYTGTTFFLSFMTTYF